jgi:hypothetical protein
MKHLLTDIYVVDVCEGNDKVTISFRHLSGFSQLYPLQYTPQHLYKEQMFFFHTGEKVIVNSLTR